MFKTLDYIFGTGLMGILASKTSSPALSASFIVAGLILTALVSYFLGSLNFALILSKRMYGEDIRNFGSKNAGTTNMARTYGKKAALFTILGDILKGVVSVLCGNALLGSVLGGGYIAGLFCVVGHVFPIFYGFRGGKGVATAAAVILMVSPPVFAIVLGVFLLCVLLTRYVSLGSCLAAALFPFLTFNFGGVGIPFLCSFVMATIVICKHHTNLKRLANGQESKFAFKKADKSNGDEQKKYTAKKKKNASSYKARKK